MYEKRVENRVFGPKKPALVVVFDSAPKLVAINVNIHNNGVTHIF